MASDGLLTRHEPFTFIDSSCMSPLVIDYIWYTTSSLSVTSLLGDVDPGYLTKVVGFPNVHFPSECVAVSLSPIVFN